ncbi:MAG: hypothetical protein A3F68_09245 [Acidobacteria bacterium RIFCSPLOWO2_12_FULL_54_10]|nr:MAG: hypothetical protein A3F68_09245 [Acidobacteria bacterium RIFCSPLOWO2_12_FULL_54_10]
MMQLFDSQIRRKLLLSTIAMIACAWAALPNAAAYCATCYSVAGVGDKVTEVLQRGIAILLIPTVAIMGFIVLRTLRSKDASSQEVPLPQADLSQEPSVHNPFPAAPPLSSSILKPR